MLNPIFSLCVYLIEMVIAYIFFSGVFERRIKTVNCIFVGCVIFLSGSCLNLLSGNNPVLNFCTTILMLLLFSVISFRAKIIQYIFNSATLVVGNMTLEMAAIAIGSYISGSNFLDYNTNVSLLIFEAISSKSLYYLFVLVISRIINSDTTTTKIPLNFLLYPITATLCLFVFWYICIEPDCSKHIQLLLAIAGVGLFLSSLLLFITYSHQVEKDREAIQVKSELSRTQSEKNYYQVLEQQNQQLMIYAHDAKNHLAAIRSLNRDPRIDSYISKLTEQLSEYTRNCHSGNKLLDVMIHKFSVDCEIRGICFDYDVKLCNLNMIEDIDLVAILGNLIDNAILAAEKSKQRWVSLATAQRNSYNIIVITNSCDTPPKHNGNRLITSKIDNHIHGFGLKSVKKTLRKYEGDFEWEYDDKNKEFAVTVMVGNLVESRPTQPT